MPIQETLGEIAKRYRQSPAAVKVGSVLLSAAVIIPGCGGSSSELSDCPSPEYYRDHAPVSGKIFDRLQGGIDALRLRISGMDDAQDNPGSTSVEEVDPRDIDPRYVDAARAIFQTDRGLLGDELMVGSSETNLDDRGEVLCEGNGGELFLTEEADMAAAELHTIGINVFDDPSQAGPSE